MVIFLSMAKGDWTIRRIGCAAALALAFAVPALSQDKTDQEALEAQAEEKADDEERNAARNNLILRRFFQMQILGIDRYDLLFSRGFRDLRRRDDDLRLSPFMERLVDTRIDRYVEDVKKKLGEIEEQIAVLRDRACARDRIDAKEAKRRFKTLAGKLSGLRKSLATVFSDLETRDDYDPKISDRSKEPLFRDEIDFIEDQYQRASRRILDYLIEPTFTIDVASLKGDSMLTYLRRAEKMARRLSKAV